MERNDAGYIIGAYPCAPSFHQKSEQEETEFWRLLADTPHIRGLEQPCHENFHPYGDEWLFQHTPQEWKMVVTAIPETMRRRGGGNTAFGLASSDEEQRLACVEFHHHLLNKINALMSWQCRTIIQPKPMRLAAVWLSRAPKCRKLVCGHAVQLPSLMPTAEALSQALTECL